MLLTCACNELFILLLSTSRQVLLMTHTHTDVKPNLIYSPNLCLQRTVQCCLPLGHCRFAKHRTCVAFCTRFAFPFSYELSAFAGVNSESGASAVCGVHHAQHCLRHAWRHCQCFLGPGCSSSSVSSLHHPADSPSIVTVELLSSLDCSVCHTSAIGATLQVCSMQICQRWSNVLWSDI